MSFVRELDAGIVTDAQLAETPGVLRVFGPATVPRLGVRVGQRLALRAGLADFDTAFLARVRRARRALLGAQAEAPPRFLIRVDEFPDSRAFDESPERWRTATRAFHETLAGADVPYLMAIVPQYTHRPLDPSATGGQPLDDRDHALIERMARDGVVFAQHGATHRTRYASPRRRSELSGLTMTETEELICEGRERLGRLGVTPRVFVPPFNRFEARQLSVLARHFDVVGAGPEAVPIMGFHGGPVWCGQAVLVPCYPPVYASARDLVPVIDRLVALGTGTWVPIVLHVSWEIGDEFRSLAAFARAVAPFACDWGSFLSAGDATRGSGVTAAG